MSNVYERLQKARIELQKADLKKSGHNKFAGYHYFELADFLPTIQNIFASHGLFGHISFNTDLACLYIRAWDKPEEVIQFVSPMSTASLKGCHDIQNLGAVETYLRRYLWVAAMEIVEHDALDATTGRKGDAPIISPRGEVQIGNDRMNVVADVALAIKERMDADDMIGAYDEYSGISDNEEKIALWGLLDSRTRAALKKHDESLRGK